MATPAVVILAAGQGTRMRSALPKVLHPLCGRPMVLWPVRAALESGARVIVVGGPDRALAPVLPPGVELAVQPRPLGTGDAVAAAAPHLDREGPVVVLSGDVPLITPADVDALLAAHAAGGAAATILTVELEDPSGYGRIVRDGGGEVVRVAETKVAGDASPRELAIREVNAGVYAFAAGPLLDALALVGSDNAQGERYLPDVLPIMRQGGARVAALRLDDPAVALGVNDRADLARVSRLAQDRIQLAHMRAGVTLLDPASTLIDAEVGIGPDTVIGPFTQLQGSTSIGSGCRIGPLATIADSAIGDGTTVLHSCLSGCEVGPRVSVGPFAYLRPGARLRDGAKAGTFVEIKNSDIGAGAKVPHLSYIGDADVGEGTNLGAATITANYDGTHKHRTTIGAHVRGGVDVTLVAPVELGDGAWTAAGSVITADVPPGALGIARERQRNVERYAERRRSR